MKYDRNPLQDLQHSLENLKGNFHVLEVNVPVEKQMEYFRYSEAIRNDLLEKSTVEKQMKVLSSIESSPSEIKYALAFLAVSGNVQAYRAIETYYNTYHDDWAAMSFMQAKITLESELSDQKQVFISTGLGGKGDQLRFYAFFKSKNRKMFSDYQRKLIEKEVPYYIQKYQGIPETIQIHDNYFTILFLIHFQVDIKSMLEEAIEECNQYGDFISKSFIITNVRVFTEEEIQNELMKKE